MLNRSALVSTTGAEPLPSGRKRSAIAETAAGHWVNWFAEQTGFGWDCVDVHAGKVVAHSDQRLIPYCSSGLRARFPHGSEPTYYVHDEWFVEVAVPMPGVTGNDFVLTSYFLTEPHVRPAALEVSAAAAGWSQLEIDAFLSQAPMMSLAIGKRLIAGVLDKLRLDSREASLEYEIGALSQQLEYTTDEITLLHSVTEHLNLTHSVRNLAELCLQRVHGLIDAVGHMLIISDEQHDAHCLIEGELPFNAETIQQLIACLENHGGTRTLVRNELASTLMGHEFPGLESLVAAAINDGTRRRGWIISCNLRYGHFGPVEANLLNTVARLLSTHSQNQHLFNEQDELLINFVRTLVSTLDAKDPYTRGHSERVALIARRLSEELGLPEVEQNDIYLSSLLHDIGKVGVDDRILRKPDQLTAEEFEQIQRHPDLGYEILKTIKHLQPILPGVRSHHEAFNGRGYPQGLSGETIPLMARIIAVADSYDAMSSDRPYRRGMPLDRVEEIFRRGAGEQWDRRVIDAYFAARDDIRALCEGYSLTDGHLLVDVNSAIWSGLGNRSSRNAGHSSPGGTLRDSSRDDSSASESTVILSHRPQTR